LVPRQSSKMHAKQMCMPIKLRVIGHLLASTRCKYDTKCAKLHTGGNASSKRVVDKAHKSTTKYSLLCAGGPFEVGAPHSLDGAGAMASHFLDLENFCTKASSFEFTDLMCPRQKSRDTQCIDNKGSNPRLPSMVMTL